MQHSAIPRTILTPAEQANLLAGKAVAYATAYLNARSDAPTLGRHARSLQYEILTAGDDPQAKAILDASRLLTVAMLATAAAVGEARQDRWQHVMAVLVELVRHESTALRTSGDPA